MKNAILSIIGFLLLPCIVQAQRIVFTPQWTPQSQFAGYYVAQDKGYYKDAGVEVEIQHPSVSYSALNRLFNLKPDAKCRQSSSFIRTVFTGINTKPHWLVKVFNWIANIGIFTNKSK